MRIYTYELLKKKLKKQPPIGVLLCVCQNQGYSNFKIIQYYNFLLYVLVRTASPDEYSSYMRL